MGCCDGPATYKPGEILSCRVLSRDSKGYSVAVGPHGHPGIMSDTIDFEVGQDVEGLFVCMLGDKAILTPMKAFEALLEEMDKDIAESSAELESAWSTTETLEERVLVILSMSSKLNHDLCRQLEARLKNGESFVEIAAPVLSPQTVETYLLAKGLLESNTISLRQFSVAFYDHCTVGISVTDSLQIRGWIAAN